MQASPHLTARRPCWYRTCSVFPWRDRSVSLCFRMSLWSSERMSACGDRNTGDATHEGLVRNLQKPLLADSLGIEAS